MIVYLAGFKTIEKIYGQPTDDIYLLSSFYEHKSGKFGKYVLQSKHILDSGAFSFFGGKSVDWVEYTNSYCRFINDTNQQLFFELDIDTITSTAYAEKLRAIIEDKTGKQPIPVWRPMRGIDYWHNMVEQYKYVAISASGAYDSSWTRDKKSIPVLQKMIKIAHDKKTKVHGLGFTDITLLRKIRFDSVDSTTWNVGGKYGNVCVFDFNFQFAKQLHKHGFKVKNIGDLHVYNFNEWVKFQRYALTNL